MNLLTILNYKLNLLWVTDKLSFFIYSHKPNVSIIYWKFGYINERMQNSPDLIHALHCVMIIAKIEVVPMIMVRVFITLSTGHLKKTFHIFRI